MVFSKPVRALIATAVVIFSAGIVQAPARAATATPFYLSFESNDGLGAQVGKAASSNRPLGYWYNSATTAISTAALPSSHPGKALDFIKSQYEQKWSGFTVFDAGTTGVQFTNGSHPIVTFDYYSPDNSPVQVKLEKGNSKTYKVAMASQGWNALSFDFTSVSGWSGSTEWSRMSIIPDFSDDATYTSSIKPMTNQHYFIDNVSVNGGTINDVTSPAPTPTPTLTAAPVYMNFESADGRGASIGSGDNNLGAFEGGSTSIASSVGGRSDKALKFVKNAGPSGKAWSGFNAILPTQYITIAKTITFDYYSPDNSNSPVMVKLVNDSDQTNAVTLAKNAVKGWQTLTFDMSTASGWSDSKKWTTLAIFPDWADANLSAAAQVTLAGQAYYIDNISLNGGTIDNVGGPSPAPSSSSSSSSCINKPALRLITPNVMDGTQNNNQPTWWSGASDYNDPDTMVYAHYYPVGSTITLTYQAYDATCKAYGAGTSVYLAVNAQYSGSQTSFTNTDSDPTSDTYGAITVIKAHASGCVPPYCAGDQTVLMQKTNAQGQVTFILVNTNKTSPENKPTDIGQNVPGGSNALGSNLSPSFKDFTPGVNGAAATGAGGSNKVSAEAIDRLLPHFVNGEGGVTAPANVTATKGTTKALTFTVKNTSGQLVANAPVTVTTDDGGTLTSPDSSGGTPNMLGLTTVNGTTDAYGDITVLATSANAGTQNITVSYVPTTSDTSLTAFNGSAKITWAAAVVKVAQTIGAVGTSTNLGRILSLPAKTSKALTITWKSLTLKVCTVTSNKLKGIKAGTCKISGTNAGNASTNPVTKAVTITVKR